MEYSQDYLEKHGYNRYLVIVNHGKDGGIDEKQAYITLNEAKKQCAYYLKEQDARGAAIYDFKCEKVIALYNGFDQSVFSPENRNDNAKIYWID